MLQASAQPGHLSRPWLAGPLSGCCWTQRPLRAGPTDALGLLSGERGRAQDSEHPKLTKGVGAGPPTRLPPSPLHPWPVVGIPGPAVRATPSSPGLLGRGPEVSPSVLSPWGRTGKLGQWPLSLAWVGVAGGTPGRVGVGGDAESPSLARPLHASPPPPLGWSTRPNQPALDS